MSGRRSWGSIPLVAVLAVLALVAGAGCESDMAKEFRDASGAELEQGVDLLMDGLIDGAFQIWAPDSTTDSTTTQ